MNLEKASQTILENNKDVLSIILTGSRARGDNKEDSDYDLVFITRRGKSWKLEKKYRKLMSEKTGISSWLLCVHLWTMKRFMKGYQKGNSFVYTTIRDGKLLASRGKNILGLELPDCREYGKERLEIGRNMLDSIEMYFEFKEMYNRETFSGIELERLGFSTMHLCWAACLLNNKCPKSKYTVLEECRPYLKNLLNFNEREFKEKFEIIKGAYKFYSQREENFDLEMDIKKVRKLYKQLSQIYNSIKVIKKN